MRQNGAEGQQSLPFSCCWRMAAPIHILGASGLQTALSYLDLALEIARRTFASREKSLRLTQVRKEEGVATQLDIRQAEEVLVAANAQIGAKALYFPRISLTGILLYFPLN
jgi:outer membrane protein TolC